MAIKEEYITPQVWIVEIQTEGIIAESAEGDGNGKGLDYEWGD